MVFMPGAVSPTRRAVSGCCGERTAADQNHTNEHTTHEHRDAVSHVPCHLVREHKTRSASDVPTPVPDPTENPRCHPRRLPEQAPLIYPLDPRVWLMRLHLVLLLA